MSTVATSTSARPGMIVGSKFALLRLLGEGAAGAVFEAEDTVMGRRVAIKLLHPQFASQPELVMRFRREAQAAATIEHPNIVTVHELGQWEGGSFYIVQEYLRGETLRERLDKEPVLPAVTALDVMVPIMGALVAAHGNGIVHRDIKPENILLGWSKFGGTVPKLIDFGIAKMAQGGGRNATRSGTLWGTVSYMSPEQAKGSAELDARTDVWSLGVVLYEMLTGKRPFDGPSEAESLANILILPIPEIVPDANVPPALAAVIKRALMRDFEERWFSMEAFLRATLEAAASIDPTLGARHARSIPHFELGDEDEELNTGDVVQVVERKPMPSVTSILFVAPPAATDLSEGVSTMHAIESEDDEEVVFELRTSQNVALPAFRNKSEHPAPPPTPDDRAHAAQHALRVNALEDAVDIAREVIETEEAGTEMVGRMRLVQAIAHYWRGDYLPSERESSEAARLLPRGTTGWYAAVGHQAMARGYLGKNQELVPMVFDLLASRATEPVTGSQVVTFCRLVMLLVRAGSVELGQRVFAKTEPSIAELGEDEPFVGAWADLARAEMAAHAGDPALYRSLVESAVKGFARAGDPRNACLQRVNVGNAYIQLGAFDEAETVLREALTVAEPMSLSFIGALKANLGIVLARQGNLKEATEIERSALELCEKQGHQRFQCVARCYLATMSTLAGERADAESYARGAVEASASSPAIRAYALATFADVMMKRDPKQALTAAQQAMDILELLGGVEEGESLVRVVYAVALDAVGKTDLARKRIDEAERRLLARAGLISDRQARKSFLENVPENRRTIVLSMKWSAAEDEVPVALMDDGDELPS